MTVLKHLHKLKRHTYATGSKIYFCVNNCSYRVDIELSLGKIVECWRCGNAFTMNVYSSTLEKPHCDACHKYRNEVRTKGKKKPVQPLTQIASLVSDSIVGSLENRLHSLTTSSDKPTSEIKEFKLDEEEDYL